MKTEQLGPYNLSWPEGVFPLGGDALPWGSSLLCGPGGGCVTWERGAASAFAAGPEGEGLSLTGVELDPLSARTARNNLERNGLAGEILPADLRSVPLPAGAFDLVVSNPPYFSLGSGGSGGAARSEEHCALEELCAAAARLVRNGGRFALCHRPERLTDVVCTLRASGLEPKRLKLVSHGPGHPPPSCWWRGCGREAGADHRRIKQRRDHPQTVPALFYGAGEGVTGAPGHPSGPPDSPD